MDRETILAIQRAISAPAWYDDGEGTKALMAPKDWQQVVPEQDAPAPLIVSTLSGLVGYAKGNIDGHDLSKLLITVDAPDRVSLRGICEDEAHRFRRPLWLRAEYESTVGFGQFKDAESFIVWLQTGFEETAGRDQILALVASIRENSVRETVDDGIAQEVKTGRGVTLVGMQKVPNPVLLAPYRTFPEVNQPASLMVLRVRPAAHGDRPELALFEADGGAWKREAMHGIGLYFQMELPEVRGLA